MTAATAVDPTGTITFVVTTNWADKVMASIDDRIEDGIIAADAPNVVALQDALKHARGARGRQFIVTPQTALILARWLKEWTVEWSAGKLSNRDPDSISKATGARRVSWRVLDAFAAEGYEVAR